MTFVAGTPISTPFGPIAIEHLVAPGYVWASNLEPVPCTPFPVRATRAAGVVALDFGDEVIRCAPERSFFTGVWTLAKRLKPGTRVWCRDGSWKQLAAIVFGADEVPGYELAVAQLHTFFVGTSELLVST